MKLRKKYSAWQERRRVEVIRKETCKTCEQLKSHNLFLVGLVDSLRDQLTRERNLTEKILDKTLLRQREAEVTPESFESIKTTKLSRNSIFEAEKQSRIELAKQEEEELKSSAS